MWGLEAVFELWCGLMHALSVQRLSFMWQMSCCPQELVSGTLGFAWIEGAAFPESKKQSRSHEAVSEDAGVVHFGWPASLSRLHRTQVESLLRAKSFSVPQEKTTRPHGEDKLARASRRERWSPAHAVCRGAASLAVGACTLSAADTRMACAFRAFPGKTEGSEDQIAETLCLGMLNP